MQHNVMQNIPELDHMVRREVRLLKACSSHPNVVRMHESFRVAPSGRACIVMELVQGSLHERLWRSPLGLPQDAVKVLLWQLLRATEFLHRNLVRDSFQITNLNCLRLNAADITAHVCFICVGHAQGLETGQHTDLRAGRPQTLRLWPRTANRLPGRRQCGLHSLRCDQVREGGMPSNT